MNGTRRIATVTQINNYIKAIMEQTPVLQNVWIKGEISNFKLHSSGHIYLTLKDGGAVLRAVMFRAAAQSLRFRPEDGMKVLARGRISVYEAGGQYQLYIEEMEAEGQGDLYAKFEALKKQLGEEGLFDEQRKKKLPQFPAAIGIATSPTGAAVRDMINILRRRYPMVRVILYPCLVQGEGAAKTVVSAIEHFNSTKSVDVIIIGRGGGSIEDLWAFNEENVARAVFECSVPVISAVGHATDVTICDFVADKTAPTPSAAAEIAVPDKIKLLNMVSSFNDRIISAARYAVYLQQQRVDSVYNRLSVFSESYRLPKIKANLDNINIRLAAAFKENLQSKAEQLKECSARLNALSPLNILARGYSLALVNDEIVSSVDDVNINDSITVKLKNGELYCNVNDKRNDYNAKEENL